MTDKVIPGLYLGLMSGTSLDGCDAVLMAYMDDKPRFMAGITRPYPQEMRGELGRLCQAKAVDLDLVMGMDIRLAQFYAGVVQHLLDRQQIPADQIRAIGSHGQTIRHLPLADHPTTLQIGDPNLLAELTGISVVADFRRRDMAAGGQGAPLVPVFHNALFRTTAYARVVLNIGGMANITILPSIPDELVRGFDTGPGNVLLDAWAQLQINQPWDNKGHWGAAGEIIPQLLTLMLTDDYFQLPPPKSTGRERFNLNWLHQILEQARHLPTTHEQARDIQATLGALTAGSIAQAILRYAPETRQILVCGGGWHNAALISRLRSQLSDCEIISTEGFGIHPDWVEGAAFAWLAAQRLAHRPGNLPSVTGARHTVVLGGIYAGK